MPAIQKLLHIPIVHKVLGLLRKMGGEGRLVGGCVRDTLIGCPVSDIDLACNMPVQEVYSYCTQKGIHVIPTGLKHGTVTICMDKRTIEVTQLRRDVQTDGRHAIVEHTTDWQEDAARRDFTMNALYLDSAGRIYDYFNGQADLQEGIVRFIGDPKARIQEDYLRILRYYRFDLYYGKCTDPSSAEAVRLFQKGLRLLSAERIQMELLRICKAPDPTPTLIKMHEDGVFLSLFQQKADIATAKEFCSLIQTYPVEEQALGVLWSLFPHAEAFFRNHFRLSNQQLFTLIKLYTTRDEPLSELTLLRLCHYISPSFARLWLLEHIARSISTNADSIEKSEVLLNDLWTKIPDPFPIFPLQGKDLLEHGFHQTPFLGRVLHVCEEWWLAHNMQSDKNACIDFCLNYQE